MHILHIIETLDFGGAEKVLVSLANGFAADHKVSVCCIKHTGELAAELDPRVTVFSLGKAEGNDYMLPFRLARRMRRERFDVVHTHNWGVFLESAVAARLAGTPVKIHTVHGPYTDYAQTPSARAKRRLRHWLERVTSRWFRAIVTVADSIQPYLINTIRIDPSRVLTIHNGIPTDGPVHQSRGDSTRFITVGRLAAIKNHELLLRAFARATAYDSRSSLVIVGDGPERSHLQEIRHQLGLTERVRLLGFRKDIPELLAAADVFVLTSRFEGISMALLEAMRASLPVIATRVGGIPETVIDGQTGILIDPDDVEALAEAMLRLTTSPQDRIRLGTAARTRLDQEFSRTAMLSRYRDLYSESLPLQKR